MNCDGLLGYEVSSPGNGAVGFFYNNADFVGVPEIGHADEMSFDWSYQNPVPGINHENFSIKWLTFLKVPVTSDYTFRCESDDGCAVLLNDEVIVKHFMGVSGGAESDDVHTWLDSYKDGKGAGGKLSGDNRRNRNAQKTEASSAPLELIGG